MMRMDTKTYRILGLDVILHSNSDRFLRFFDTDYSFFASSRPVGEGEVVSLWFLDEGRDRFSLLVNGTTHSLGDYPDPHGQAYQMVSTAVMEKVRGFSIIHAGVVAREGKALIISGPAGSGKTTLTAALMERGFHFLSDDFCPLHQETGLVHPFPRAMWVAGPKTRENQKADTALISGCHVRPRKIPIAPDRFKGKIVTKPCAPKSLITIDPGPRKQKERMIQVQTTWAGERRLCTFMEGLGEVVMKKLQPDLPVWLICYPEKPSIAREVRRCLIELDAHIVGKHRLDGHNPDFSGETRLIPVSRHEAVYSLMAELKGVQDRPGAFFMKLNEILSGVSCYRLPAGRLDSMIDCALRAVN
jgi:hypothetical protein